MGTTQIQILLSQDSFLVLLDPILQTHIELLLSCQCLDSFPQ